MFTKIWKQTDSLREGTQFKNKTMPSLLASKQQHHHSAMKYYSLGITGASVTDVGEQIESCIRGITRISSCGNKQVD